MAAINTSIDLSDPKNLRRQVLSPAEANARYVLLSDLEEDLVNRGESLSPRSGRELRELATLVTRSRTEILQGTFPIYRLPTVTPWYEVRYGSSKIEYYSELSQQIVELPQTGVKILQAMQSTSQANWFYHAIGAHTQDVFGASFMGVLRSTLIANICVLRASLILSRDPKLFLEVLNLYAESNNLYNHQISYNRQVELTLLTSAEQSYFGIKSLHARMPELCGPALNEDPRALETSRAFLEKETQLALTANNEIIHSCNTFLARVSELETKVQHCLDNISHQHQAVRNATGEVKKILHQQEVLNEKQVAIQAEYEGFQRKKDKEIASRKEVVEKSGFSILGVDVFSQSKTVVKEDDFGSKDAYRDYLEAKAERKRLNEALDLARSQLANAMVASGVIQYGQDLPSLQKAADSLATALTCIGELRVALLKRKAHSEDQVRVCSALLRHPDIPLEGLQDALMLLEISLGGVIKKEALWLGSSRQTFTLQKCQQLEENIRLGVINALAKSIEDKAALQACITQLEKFLPQNLNQQQIDQLVDARLVTLPEMLALTMEGSSQAIKK